jgi:predicted anti-sigma-YlaC factor YlaD
MNCEVIGDLLPLYIDECCSEESAKLVEAHLEYCADCRNVAERMRSCCMTPTVQPSQRVLRSISSWKASLLQSVMLFVSFAVMTLGVILEGSTPAGETNGLWAAALIVPAAGYLLSLANWFFVQIYTSRRKFSVGCCAVTAALIVLGYGWAAVHYAAGIALTEPLLWGGAALSTAFCVLSKILSDRYAMLLGKE